MNTLASHGRFIRYCAVELPLWLASVSVCAAVMFLIIRIWPSEGVPLLAENPVYVFALAPSQ